MYVRSWLGPKVSPMALRTYRCSSYTRQARIMDGKEVSRKILAQLKECVKKDKELDPQWVPKLSIIQVGENPASALYIR